MGWLSTLIKAAGQGIIKGFEQIWSSLSVWITAGFTFLAAVLSAVIEWVTWACSGLQAAQAEFTSAVSGAGTYSPAAASGALYAGLCFVNRMFPVTETVAMGGILLLVTKAGIVYRFIKSWIPTVAT